MFSRFHTRFSASVFRNPSLIIFLFSRVAGALAFQMLAVAVGWQMYSLTHSAFYLGLVGLAQFIPMLLLTLPAGHVADTCDRRGTVRLCQIIEGLGVGVLGVGSIQGWLTKESILALVLLIGAANAFEKPSLHSLLPGLVTPEQFPKASAVNASLFETATIIGPALGGLLYAFQPAIVYFLAGTLYLTSGLVVSLIRIRQPLPKKEPVTLQSLLAGISFIKSKPAILGAISLDLFAVLFGGATALLPIYASQILLIGPQGLGILRAAPAVGAVLMSLWLARSPIKRKAGLIMFAAVLVFGIATLGFALSTSFVLSLGALLILGAADVISVVIRSSLVQLNTPDEMRGRVSAVNLIFIGTSNQLGEFESGITASWMGVVPAAVLGGVGTIIVACLWMRLFPVLVKMESVNQPVGESCGISD